MRPGLVCWGGRRVCGRLVRSGTRYRRRPGGGGGGVRTNERDGVRWGYENEQGFARFHLILYRCQASGVTCNLHMQFPPFFNDSPTQQSPSVPPPTTISPFQPVQPQAPFWGELLGHFVRGHEGAEKFEGSNTDSLQSWVGTRIGVGRTVGKVF